MAATKQTKSERYLERTRKIIAAWPETDERPSHGTPTWWGGKKTFATFHAGGYDDGREAVWIKAPEGMQAALIERDPERFYRPKYLGPKGWVAVRLEGKVDWGEAPMVAARSSHPGSVRRRPS